MWPDQCWAMVTECSEGNKQNQDVLTDPCFLDLRSVLPGRWCVTDTDMEVQDSGAWGPRAQGAEPEQELGSPRMALPALSMGLAGAPTFCRTPACCLPLESWCGGVLRLQTALKQGILLSIFFLEKPNMLYFTFFTIYLNISHIQNKVHFSVCPRNMTSLEPWKRRKWNRQRTNAELKKRTILGTDDLHILN